MVRLSSSPASRYLRLTFGSRSTFSMSLDSPQLLSSFASTPYDSPAADTVDSPAEVGVAAILSADPAAEEDLGDEDTDEDRDDDEEDELGDGEL